MHVKTLTNMLAQHLINSKESKNIVWKTRINSNSILYMETNCFQNLLRSCYSYGWIIQNSSGMICVTEKGIKNYKEGIIALNNIVTQGAEKKILISHNSNDVKYCELLVSFLEDIGLTSNEVICTSITGYGIKLNEDIFEWLAGQFNNDLYVIFLLSNNYYKSAASLNEMGATWVLQKEYTTVLLSGFEIRNVYGAVNPRKIATNLDDSEEEIRLRLAELRDVFIGKFNLDTRRLNESMWYRTQSRFLDTLRNLAKD